MFVVAGLWLLTSIILGLVVGRVVAFGERSRQPSDGIHSARTSV